MSSIALGSPEAREVLRRDYVRRTGHDPNSRAGRSQETKLPETMQYVPAWWDRCEDAVDVEEDEDAIEE